MQFNSLLFALFFGVVLLAYYVPPWSGRAGWGMQKGLLLAFSYLFYAAAHPPFAALLAFSTVVDWFAAKGMHRADSLVARRGWLLASLATNLGMLGFFKYGEFLLVNFADAVHGLGWTGYEPPEWSILLPVGISFFTFQTLSYTIDVYRGNAEPWDSFLDFALYVSFFPQLVAGPIVRATDFLPQLAPEEREGSTKVGRRASGPQFSWGLSLLVVGLFEKVVVADGLLAPVANQVFGSPGAEGATERLAEGYTFVSAWVGTLAFAGQIFCDFAGYSTCAIGVAMCLGFALPENFRYPYAAVGFSDFWRRWHISLSTWLRDYLYIPLGGNRGGRAFVYRNLMLTMLLGGIWHGAAWTFLAWGGLHGALLILERGLRALPSARWELWRRWYGELFLISVTFAAICVTWVFFRAGTFEQAWSMLSALSGASGMGKGGLLLRDVGLTGVGVGGVLAVHYLLRNTTLEAVADRLPWWVTSCTLAAMTVLIVLSPPSDEAFIYFQF
ncbi:MBOAT family O-acyltransferase [Alienimonas californiensis]|uniref:Peptidoglycan O-acetyltransferase n=1 Tax=Alienimonas californiensis TaxID=2527989 RepID=A0A517P442_9PLAN|nr:MBOAT family O-acyltransferase [Alienimonas californiensis]QDT14148.1 Peptidoglycan O-acetyltransferase [Alienimonas californiensis]